MKEIRKNIVSPLYDNNGENVIGTVKIEFNTTGRKIPKKYMKHNFIIVPIKSLNISNYKYMIFSKDKGGICYEELIIEDLKKKYHEK